MKGKLYHTDIILPIIAGLKKNNYKEKIKLIYPSRESLEFIKKNKSLYRTLLSIAEIKHFYSTEELKKFYIPEEDKWIKIKVCSSALKSINKFGISAVLKKAKEKGTLSI